MAVEIEMRARFDKETHDRLLNRLRQDGEDLGDDAKHIYFYVLPEQLLKVTDSTAAGTAKITLKGSKIGQGAAFPETEFAIAREDVPTAVKVFNALGFENAMHEAFNFRHNFHYQGVEIALKWSEAWGYHAEFEVLLDDGASDAAHDDASAQIIEAAAELGVTLMSEQELADFTAAFEAAEQERKAHEARAAPIR
ncbi:CYTH domain-containing protein [Kitasatospora acidiphila]|uniref:CYTH domain-containing protein n=1 Tax=Kitasatospora acidiphila TaxID=2567942 RepID=A0A540W5H0_9ACTN|nr:CYTH domain-containing protein [Kitasatospora acidiphila]TQF04233.1 CYTH domain-containing protein [Kitasatospora acidiphila]